MRATTEPLEGNLVRLSVEIDEPEFDRALGDVVRTLARQVRVPGFRPGKVPRQVLEARMGGAGALRAEALRESLPDFYARAVVDTELDPDRAARDRHHRRRGTPAPSPSTPWSRCGPSSPFPVTTACRSPCPDSPSPTRRSNASSTGCARTTRARSGRPPGDRRRPGHHRPARQRRRRGRGRRRRRLPLRGRQRGPSFPSSTPSCTAPRPAPSWPSTRRTRPRTREQTIAFRVLVKEVKSRSCPRPPTSGRRRTRSSRPWPNCEPTCRGGSGAGEAHAESDGAAPEDDRGAGRAGGRRRRPRGPGRRGGQRAAPRPRSTGWRPRS